MMPEAIRRGGKEASEPARDRETVKVLDQMRRLEGRLEIPERVFRKPDPEKATLTSDYYYG